MGPSCLLLLLCSPFCCAVLFGRPHIIFIVADDLGWNDVSFHGSDQIPTPNIDSLAFNGVILNSHYSQSTCTASRAALMTGRYPVHLGMQGASLLSAEPRGLPPGKLLPEYLRELGYTNRAVGKWNLGFYKRELTPTYRGFDSHLGYWTNHVSYYDYIHQSQSKDDELNGFDLRHNLSLAKQLAGSYATDVFTDEAVRIISTHGVTEPLFLYVAHQAPHAGNKGKLLEAPQEVINQFSHIADPNRRTYAAMVSKLDESVGRIMGALQRKGMLGDSIIVFISDNGAPTKGESPNWGSNYPLRGIKDSLWEGGVRVLGLVWSPLLQQTPRVSNQVMHVTDWLPTLYTAAGGIPPLNGLDGVNQWDAIVYNLPSQRTEVLININEKKRTAAIRFQNYKLIIGSSGETFDKHFGETWTTSSSPPYNYSAITNSKAGTAIAKLYRSLYRPAASALHLPYIRSEATLLCTPRNPGFSCDPAITKQSCLYDVEHDPCETDNIAETYPDIVQHLRGLLVRHRQSLVPQSNLPTAPFSANPSIWGNIWTTWGSGGEVG